MEQAPANHTTRLALLGLIVLATLACPPASAARTLQELQPTPGAPTVTPQPTFKPLVFRTQKPVVTFPPTDPWNTAHGYDDHTCPDETEFVAWAGPGACGKKYLTAEKNGDAHPDNGGALTTEGFPLYVDNNYQQNGAVLLDCYKNMKTFLSLMAGENTAGFAMKYLGPDTWLTDEAGQFVIGAQAVAVWFTTHFGNQPAPTVKVYEVSWDMDANGKFTILRMIVRAEMDAQVITFATHWDVTKDPEFMFLINQVRIVTK